MKILNVIESLSPFLFSMYLNDIEDEFYLNGIEGIDIHHIKLFSLLYADDITLFSETTEGLQTAQICCPHTVGDENLQ